MNEKGIKFLEDFEKAINNLKIATENVKENDLYIDGTIKRFELCYELTWKFLKHTLADISIIVNNPCDTFKYGLQNNFIDNEENWLKMIEDRNLLVRTYTTEQSREVFGRIREIYVNSFENLLNKIKQ